MSTAPPVPVPPVLEARGFSVANLAGLLLLRDIDMTLRPGQVLGLVGESGAGKSMIGRSIAGRLPAGFRAAAGTLRFRGRDLVTLPAPERRALLGREIGFIPQEPLTSLNPSLTIARQFGEHLGRLGVTRRERMERMRIALEEVRLHDPATVLRSYSFQLSGGMCQRILIAMAFAGRPALIVADEPTTALDVSTQAHVMLLMRQLQERSGTSVVFITHDLRLAGRVCHDVAVLYAGDLVEHGTAAAVLMSPGHPYTRALNRASPAIDGPILALRTLPDQMPSLSVLADLPGCRFAPRCPTRDPACAGTQPPLRPVGPQHFARCTDLCLAGDPPVPLLQAAVRRTGTEVLLRLAGIGKTFPAPRGVLSASRQPIVALHGIALTVHRGEFLGIVGESGSGKSTLARVMAGLSPPSAGQIELDGANVTSGNEEARQRRLRTLQFIFQDPQSALNPRRNVEQLLTQALDPGGRTLAAERRARALVLLADTKMPAGLLSHYPSQLSGGQKQRLNIARALCVAPRLLIADEIVSGLDVLVQAQIISLLQELRAARDFSLVLISHDLAVVRVLCERVLVMHKGRIVEEGPVDQVFTAPQHAYTRMLLDSVPPADPAQPWLAAGQSQARR